MSSFTEATRPADHRKRPDWYFEYKLLRSVEVDDDGCWIWQGRVADNGYGYSSAWSKTWLAHRLAYTLMVGPIPEGLTIDHLCRVRTCINPQHLEAVTLAENIRRAGAAVTHCPRHHEYTPENTYVGSSGGRSCRTCTRQKNAQNRRPLSPTQRARSNDLQRLRRLRQQQRATA